MPVKRPLRPAELFWVRLQPFLLEKGYKLRPRFSPNWTPSWQSGKRPFLSKRHEDGLPARYDKLIDAVRIRDGIKVILRRVDLDEDASVHILRYLNSAELLADSRNKTVPLLDILPLPSNKALIVMPMLHPFDSVQSPFRYVSEVVEAFDQFLQGLVFMHEHRIAHRDACFFNLMVDPSKICPKGFHFGKPKLRDDFKTRSKWLERRSVGPLNYYFIDFEMSEYFPPGPNDRVCFGIYGQDKDVPEMSLTIAYDPFKLDVFQLGGAMTRLMKWYDGLDFLSPITNAMKCQDPGKRPTAAEAYQMFQEMLAQLTEEDLSQPVWPSNWPQSMRKHSPTWKSLLGSLVCGFLNLHLHCYESQIPPVVV